ncbi:hypothetical protein [Jiella avicenniae]|uniref:Uncharacterized protein n=1 Tax=Jiella avicenniae TaxID=2907202 RepID=A0A9X1P078_9HYPH|nr:hypothetical protein [Jiella avicenniae]MCE7028118.1 hypothetical protein [Jiella avicenniae]
MAGTHPITIEKGQHSLLMRWRIQRCVNRVLADETAQVSDFHDLKSTFLGSMPTGKGPPVILAACNEHYYWDFARTMLRSIDRHRQPERFHLHLCEPSDAVHADIRELAARLSAIDLTVTWDEGYGARLPRHEPIYFACVRFLLAPLVLAATQSSVLCLDIDGIARRPITPAYEEMRGDEDVRLIKRPAKRNSSRKVLASAVGFNATPSAIRFADRLARSITGMLKMRPGYHVDQIALHLLVAALEERGELRTAQMPMAFADHEFNETSAIWTAKGWKRKNAERYRAEMALIEPANPEAPNFEAQRP